MRETAVPSSTVIALVSQNAITRSFVRALLPFVCQFCNLNTLSGIIERQRLEIAALKTELCSDLVQQQRSEIAALKGELTEIKGLLAARRSALPPTKSYATMAAGTSRCQQTQPTLRARRAAPGPQRPLGVSTASTTVSVPAESGESESDGEKERVSGARRVWGTLPTTQSAAVISTLKKLTKAGSKVRVYRKFRTSRQGKACWWFNLKGNENDLCMLESEWDSVALQTKWKLEHCYKPNAMPNNPTPAVEQDVHANSDNSATDVPPTNEQRPTDDKDSEEAPTAALTLVNPSQLSNHPLQHSAESEHSAESDHTDNCQPSHA